MASCWKLLGIKRTTDIAVIKKAYAGQAALCHPEDDPEGFSRLHMAYREALAKAEEAKKPAVQTRESEEAAPAASESGPQPANRFHFSTGASENAHPSPSEPEARPAPRFHFPAPTHEQQEDLASRPAASPATLTFPRPAVQTRLEPPLPTPQMPETQTPSSKPDAPEPRARNAAATAARESFDAALIAVRLGSGRNTILDLLEKTRKAFPQSSRRTPWEYIIARPEFAEVRLDAVFLEKLLAFMQGQRLPAGFWQVLTDAYAADFACLPDDEQSLAGTSSSAADRATKVAPLLLSIRRTIDEQLTGHSGQEPKETSWRATIGALFSGRRNPTSR